VDWFVARFTFYLRILRAGTYVFNIASDDESELYIDSVLVGSRRTDLARNLTVGQHLIQVMYNEYWGLANINLQYATPLSPMGPIPWFLISSFETDAPAVIAIRVNRVPALQACTPAGAAADPTCTFTFSSALTPTLTQPVRSTPV
ncbi:fibrocystin-L, partial [Haematococcus lacustris]